MSQKRKRKPLGQMLYEQRQERKRYEERKMGLREVEPQPVTVAHRRPRKSKP